MASVASTYARAFADVVFTAHLDAARAIGGLQADRDALWREPGTAAGLGESGCPRGSKAQVAGRNCAARRDREAPCVIWLQC